MDLEVVSCFSHNKPVFCDRYYTSHEYGQIFSGFTDREFLTETPAKKIDYCKQAVTGRGFMDFLLVLKASAGMRKGMFTNEESFCFESSKLHFTINFLYFS